MIGQRPEHLVGYKLARLGIVVQALLGQDLVHGRPVEHAPAGPPLVIEPEHHIRAVVNVELLRVELPVAVGIRPTYSRLARVLLPGASLR